jgi:hypothetical protein
MSRTQALQAARDAIASHLELVGLREVLEACPALAAVFQAAGLWRPARRGLDAPGVH